MGRCGNTDSEYVAFWYNEKANIKTAVESVGRYTSPFWYYFMFIIEILPIVMSIYYFAVRRNTIGRKATLNHYSLIFRANPGFTVLCVLMLANFIFFIISFVLTRDYR
jgi:hypothetical protein